LREFVSLAPPERGRVVLLGIAYRHISVKFTPKTRKPSQPKPLPASVKTMADWIQVKLREHGMAPYHLAFKMGIASSVVNAWTEGFSRPQNRQMREMVTILGTYGHGRSNGSPMASPD
jgi:ribosome-binding protein aMBF1 (putative translation factor)